METNSQGSLDNMSEDWTKEIRERLEQATPGPWKYDWGNWEVEREENRSWVCDLHDPLEEGFKSEVQPSCNGEFIANAPTDIANLLKEREVLREAIKNMLDACHKGYGRTLTEMEKALSWKPEEK